MLILSRTNTVIYKTYGIVRRRARPIIVVTILFVGRSEILRRAGVIFLKPFPKLIQRIRGLAVTQPLLSAIEIKPVDHISLVSSSNSFSGTAMPSVRLGSHAALLRYRIDITLAPILASRG